ncbi:MAG TPA: 2Fe-2S iron-sulfur cluster-binding protein [Gallionella sp.]|nr:2Fe-2S iron-sulfur cluster-binding protein [Gallionella sp.]
MTTQQLLTLILLGLLAQVAVFAVIGLRRHRKTYRLLETRLGNPEAPPACSAPETGHAVPETATTAVSGAGWEGYRKFRVQRRVIEDQAQSICSFYLVPVDGEVLPTFKPGQFLTFQVPVTGAGGNIVRCYSLSNRPGADYYRVSIKRALPPAGVPGALPGVSSNHFHDHVRQGDLLMVKAPAGHFYLEPGNEPVVLVAGGIGITPMLSMLGASLRDNPTREVWLFYGVRNSTEQIMKAQLEELVRTYPNFHLQVCYSKPAANDIRGVDYQHEGHVNVNLLRLALPLNPYHFYICGPRAMMETLVPAMEQWGIPPQRIHYEAFGPASLPHAAKRSQPAPATDAGTGVMVTFEKSGKQFKWDGSASYLLDFAEEHYIPVTSGCRAGGCGSCQTSIVAGEVEYLQVPDFDPALGTCLLCVAIPKTDLTLSA